MTMTSVENLLLQTHLNQTIIALSPTSTFQFLSHLPVKNMANTDRPSCIAELFSVSEFSSVEKANQCSDFFAHCSS